MSVATRRRSSVIRLDIPYEHHAPDPLPKLLIPRPNAPPPHDNSLHPYTHLLSDHLAFRQAAEPWRPDLPAAAQQDLHAIETAFPALRHARSVRAMAAWFAALCTVDDLVEELDAGSTLAALQQDDIPGAPPCGNDSEGTVSRVRHITRALDAHWGALWPRSSSTARLRAAVRETWAAIAAEAPFRCAGGTAALTPAAYMALRRRTIGIAPLVEVLVLDAQEQQQQQQPHAHTFTESAETNPADTELKRELSPALLALRLRGWRRGDGRAWRSSWRRRWSGSSGRIFGGRGARGGMRLRLWWGRRAWMRR
ncbi:uncharacterized protein K452DRAFT_312294 [Aplosporella prunicola CBS 121167]|uniref:Terpenoid synthase n=1 Tax=Aplosporella prunicola CBS 121167 TaxID=1176127 RepID=A0A6A6AZV3_9PEZI|nr:uncharacterized protein K452DRAFT_312294 [Aplosporella prunicola CBS 121167]KAF2137472.1 hypothetical protein K452DRAFT_312294 [Aplosporella prunicola CBS 121167]